MKTRIGSRASLSFMVAASVLLGACVDQPDTTGQPDTTTAASEADGYTCYAEWESCIANAREACSGDRECVRGYGCGDAWQKCLNDLGAQ